ncbi:MAG: class B sortase [Clostridia bacterium]|nr:class B sortase [Clostridia bacterium]
MLGKRKKKRITVTPGRGAFIDSLYAVTPEELGAIKKKKAKRRLINGASDILLIGCIVVFIACAFTLVSGAMDAQIAEDIYSEAAEGLFEEEGGSYYGAASLYKEHQSPSLYGVTDLLRLGISGEVSNVTVSSGNNLQIERIRSRLKEMKAQNPDIYGYIKIEDTNISYPFVLGEDNEFYLVHDAIQRGYLDSGSIFADYRCSRKGVEYNRNTVLYGHNMTRGTMFAELIKYNDEEFFRTHDIYVYTETGLYVYRPYAFFKTNERHQYFRVIFLSDDDYLGFIKEMQSLSMFETDIELTAADRVLTLSTCTNITYSGRYCLQAKLIRVEQ